MKNSTKTIATIILVCIGSTTYGQFQQILGSGVYETQSSVNKIGIGDYTSSTDVQSALQVDGNLLNTTTGEVFRTDAPSGATFWRLLREGNEYGTIYNDDDDHFYINAADASGNLYLGNNTSATAITVENGTGDIGIGTATPTYLLDVNGGDINLTDDANFFRIAGEEALYCDGSNLMVG